MREEERKIDIGSGSGLGQGIQSGSNSLLENMFQEIDNSLYASVFTTLPSAPSSFSFLRTSFSDAPPPNPVPESKNYFLSNVSNFDYGALEDLVPPLSLLPDSLLSSHQPSSLQESTLNTTPEQDTYTEKASLEIAANLNRWNLKLTKSLLDAVTKFGADWSRMCEEDWCRAAHFSETDLSQKFEEVKKRPEAVDWTGMGLRKDDFFESISIRKRKRPRKSEKWNEAELEALHKGVELFGKGSWMQMKRHLRALRNRTAISIKDKWRSMQLKQRQKRSVLS